MVQLEGKQMRIDPLSFLPSYSHATEVTLLIASNCAGHS